MGNCIYKYKLNTCSKENTPKYSFKDQNKICKVLDVYDGDTITIAIKLERNIFKVKVRMFGYDSPEMKPLKILNNREEIKKKALEAKKILENKILNKIVNIEIKDFDKYGRLLGIIIYNEENINNYMINNNYGYAYYGGTKK